MTKRNKPTWDETTNLDPTFYIGESAEEVITEDPDVIFFDEDLDEAQMFMEALSKVLQQTRAQLVAAGHQTDAKPGEGKRITMPGLSPQHMTEIFHDRIQKAAAHYYSLPHHERARLHQESRALRNDKPMISPFDANPKTAKDTPGHITTIMHLLPSTASGIDTCPNATKGHDGCMIPCLNDSGNPASMSGKAHGRLDRMRHLWHNPIHAIAQIDHEIHHMKAEAATHGKKLGIRLNGTSDIPWHNLAPQMFKEHKDVAFYDYSKRPEIVHEVDHPDFPKNYHVTLSSTGIHHDQSNWGHCSKYLAKGGTVAVAFARRSGSGNTTAQPLPTHMHDEATGKTYPVIDADNWDGRMVDKKVHGIKGGHIAGLHFKKAYKRKRSQSKDGSNYRVIDHETAGAFAVRGPANFTGELKGKKQGDPHHEVVVVKPHTAAPVAKPETAAADPAAKKGLALLRKAR